MDGTTKVTELNLNRPDPEVIASLKQALADAESGRLQGFVLVGSLLGGRSLSLREGSINRPEVVAFAARIQHEAMMEWTEDAVDEEEDD